MNRDNVHGIRDDTISRNDAIDAVAYAQDGKDAQRILEQLPSAQPDWGKPVGNGRPLADSEIIPRLQAIKAQIGGSYAIDRAIEVLEGLQDAQPESCDGCKSELDGAYGECNYCKRNFTDMYEKGEQDE